MPEEFSVAVANEVVRADQLLASLAGEEIKALTLTSLEASDAPFLALIVSKLSPIIGNLLERRIVQLLAGPSDHGLRWIRQDPGFPDALLVGPDGQSTESGYEVKAWYALSTELTGRFRESTNLLEPRNVRVAIIAWMMSHVVYGTPTILGVLTVDAASVAAARDKHYSQPPNYLTVEPGDTTLRTRNLQQTNVNGYKLQSADPRIVREATAFVASHAGRAAPPHSAEAQALANELMARFPYRLDTNFAKIDRVDHPDIEAFKSKMLTSKVRGRALSAWARLLADLNNESNPAGQERAAATIQAVYDEL